MMSSGCANTTGATTSEACCAFLAPITYSDKDTQQTIDQIIRYDRLYEALCQ